LQQAGGESACAYAARDECAGSRQVTDRWHIRNHDSRVTFIRLFLFRNSVPAWKFRPSQYSRFMKLQLLVPLILSLALVGCSDSSNKSAPGSTNAASGGSPLTAPVDYLNSAAKAQHSATKTVDITSVNKAIEMFNVQEGRFPNDLNELVAKKYMPMIPTPPVGSRIDYDAKTGTAKIVNQ
jgi:hypothetical protein